MTPTNLEKMEEIAKAATPGPWDVCSYNEKNGHQQGHIISHDQHTLFIPCAIMPKIGIPTQEDVTLAWERGERNADYVAAFDPPTVLGLIAEIRELREALEQVEKMFVHESRTSTTVEMMMARIAREALAKGKP